MFTFRLWLTHSLPINRNTAHAERMLRRSPDPALLRHLNHLLYLVSARSLASNFYQWRLVEQKKEIFIQRIYEIFNNDLLLNHRSKEIREKNSFIHKTFLTLFEHFDQFTKKIEAKRFYTILHRMKWNPL